MPLSHPPEEVCEQATTEAARSTGLLPMLLTRADLIKSSLAIAAATAVVTGSSSSASAVTGERTIHWCGYQSITC